MSADAETRAERLEVAMLAFGLVREHPRDAMAALEEVPLITEDEMEVWGRGDDEDVRIAHACLNAQFELRESQWRALGLLDLARHGPPAEPDVPTRLSDNNSPRRHTVRSRPHAAPVATADEVAVRRADLVWAAEVILGWDRPAPTPEDDDG